MEGTTYCWCGHTFELHSLWAEPDGVQDSICKGCAIDGGEAEHAFDEDTVYGLND